MIGRLLAAAFGRRQATDEPQPGSRHSDGEAAGRIEAAQRRLKETIPPRPDDDHPKSNVCGTSP